MKTIPRSLLVVFIGCAVALASGQTPAVPSAPKASTSAGTAGLGILTPPSPATPRINGPDIFGARPGSPFLYSIPATGERPMTFAIDNLPEGLKVDASTGQITGAVAMAGEYPVTLVARNALGENSKTFRIEIGEAIALTPAMGWNSWNCWGERVDQAKVLAAAKAMVGTGLAQHGWTYINIDDTWQGSRGGEFNAIQPNPKRFPDLPRLIGTIHSLGLKAGIYSTPWVTSYAGCVGGSAQSLDGAWSRPKSHGPYRRKILPYSIGEYTFADRDARQWGIWGIDYLKYDWGPVELPETRQMAAALRASGRDILFSVSNNTSANIFSEIKDLSPLANSWRTTTDIFDTWKSVCRNGFSSGKWAPYVGPGHFIDPDMLVVGQIGWGNSHPTRLTQDEQYTHMSLWCLLSAPLLIGCDLTKIDAFTLSLLSNDEVLAVDQDSLGKEATPIFQDKDQAIYAKPMEDGSWAIGLFNLSESPRKIGVKWSDLKLDASQRVRDLWRQKDIGVFADGYSATVARHGTVLVRVFPASK